MKRPVRWSRAALDDFAAQIEYIALDDPGAARRVAARINAVGAGLGQMATGRRGRVSGTYEKVVAGLPHILVYTIGLLPDGREALTILRVIHGAQNWPKGG